MTFEYSGKNKEKYSYFFLNFIHLYEYRDAVTGARMGGGGGGWVGWGGGGVGVGMFPTQFPEPSCIVENI